MIVDFTWMLLLVHPALMVPLIAAITGFAVELVWRRAIRPRAAWNDGGIAVVTAETVAQLRWDEVRDIDRKGVWKHGSSRAYDVAAAGWDGTLPTGGRSTEQLLAALWDTLRRAVAVPEAYRPDPPELPYPARPALLWTVWLAATALVSAMLLAIQR